jgi:hypothetical protein
MKEQLKYNPEQDETPEVVEVEKIAMGKLQDINSNGIAFHTLGGLKDDKQSGISSGLIGKIFLEGLLGWPNSLPSPAPSYYGKNRDAWIRAGREGLRQYSIINFNIVGRDVSSIRDSYWFGFLIHDQYLNGEIVPGNKKENAIGIIFDLSDFSEDQPMAWDTFKNNPDFQMKFRSYRAVNPKSDTAVNGGLPVPSFDCGFALFPPRVSPKMFRGIVVGDPTSDGVRKIISLMLEIYQEKPNLVLPIYNEQGGLLWPMQMSYEEVKKSCELK